jgi:hypothetical protein
VKGILFSIFCVAPKKCGKSRENVESIFVSRHRLDLAWSLHSSLVDKATRERTEECGAPQRRLVSQKGVSHVRAYSSEEEGREAVAV